MLNLPGHAAVMYFHVWTPRRLGFAFYESPENVSCTASHCDCQLRRACCGAKRAVPSHEGGLHAMSDQVIEMVPEYYGLPSMSMRNAMYHMVADFTVPADWLWRSDINHANCLGHRFFICPSISSCFNIFSF